jgi:hypothetical protein
MVTGEPPLAKNVVGSTACHEAMNFTRADDIEKIPSGFVANMFTWTKHHV